DLLGCMILFKSKYCLLYTSRCV
ncbi:hypothetical protein A5852_000017, partial [Enterococcus faecium]